MLREMSASRNVAHHVAVIELPPDISESSGRRVVLSINRSLKSLLGDASRNVRVSFHSVLSPFFLEAGARTQRGQDAIATALRNVTNNVFRECRDVSLDECDQRSRLEDLYAGELDSVTAFRVRQPLLLLRGPSATAVATVRDMIVTERFPYDDPLPVEKVEHAFSLGRHGTLVGATELRLISVNNGHISAEIASLLWLAVQNCKELQCVELALCTGLTEDDVIHILAAPSVRFVSIEGLPFADSLRASTHGAKCVETFAEDAQSQRFLAYVNEATLFLDECVSCHDHSSGEVQFEDEWETDNKI